jgi:gamma-glutamylputrescine oxidase
MASDKLTDREQSLFFPDKPLMIWDTDQLYEYYRIIKDGRLLLGGSTLTQTYALTPQHNNTAMHKKLNTYWNSKFPQYTPQFRYMWPGLLGVSKDIMPLAGRDAHEQSLYYIAGAAGLPWALALGIYSDEVVIDGRSELDSYFSPSRPFTFGPRIQSIL